MTMFDIYRSRRDNLLLRIRESKSLYETGSVISEAFETMQYQYLSQPGNEALTDKLARIMTLTKASFPLLESVNKYKMWENAEENKQPKKKSPLPGFAMLLIGVAMVMAPLCYYMFVQSIPFADMQTHLMVMGGGCLVILIAGFMLFFRRKIKTKTVVEISADAEDIVKRLEEVVKQIDIMLAAEKEAMKRQSALLASAINDDEAQLFGYLMEAKLSGQRDFALEQLDEVEHYLAKQDVILVNYTKGNEKYFDFLTGEETKTIRPAFLRGGRIMLKGLAQLKEDTVVQE
ncbi:MAG: hypothetical protein IJ410_05050 [Oscillospiraceae bacterium]|nr:hypothetical protein [Oscillospiraceae bacterium]